MLLMLTCITLSLQTPVPMKRLWKSLSTTKEAHPSTSHHYESNVQDSTIATEQHGSPSSPDFDFDNIPPVVMTKEQMKDHLQTMDTDVPSYQYEEGLRTMGDFIDPSTRGKATSDFNKLVKEHLKSRHKSSQYIKEVLDYAARYRRNIATKQSKERRKEKGTFQRYDQSQSNEEKRNARTSKIGAFAQLLKAYGIEPPSTAQELEKVTRPMIEDFPDDNRTLTEQLRAYLGASKTYSDDDVKLARANRSTYNEQRRRDAAQERAKDRSRAKKATKDAALQRATSEHLAETNSFRNRHETETDHRPNYDDQSYHQGLGSEFELPPLPSSFDSLNVGSSSSHYDPNQHQHQHGGYADTNQHGGYANTNQHGGYGDTSHHQTYYDPSQYQGSYDQHNQNYDYANQHYYNNYPSK